MGRIVATLFCSLDQVVESPHLFVFPYFDEHVGAAVSADSGGADAFLMGHRLYEEWSQYWPTNTEDPFATLINGAAKYVVAGAPFAADWAGTTVLTGPDLVAQVAALKDRTGTVVVSGSATTVRWLLTEGLLDELRLLVFPVVVGSGARLFGSERRPMTLLASEALPTGVLHLTYAPAPPEVSAASEPSGD